MLGHDEFLQALGRRIAKRRAELGLSQVQVADRLGISSVDMVSRYERGIADAKLSTIARLANALECQPRALIPSIGTQRLPNPATSDLEPQLLDAFRELPPERARLAVKLVRSCRPSDE